MLWSLGNWDDCEPDWEGRQGEGKKELENREEGEDVLEITEEEEDDVEVRVGAGRRSAGM